MRTVPATLQAHLDTGATTLCWCWRVTRADGSSLGFTDHDRVLTFEGTAFEAAAGFEASEVDTSLGLATDNVEIVGALSSDRLAAADLSAGAYDGAAVEAWRVNWSDPDQRVLMLRGTLGEVRRGRASFAAEVRGLAHQLQRPSGRTYQFTCDAELGDGRCGVAMGAFTAEGSVVAIGGSNRLRVDVGAFAHVDRLARGALTFTSGRNAGRRIEIKEAAGPANAIELALWAAIPYPVEAGDRVTIAVGCDKTFGTCRNVFGNATRFRGFPHMPGNDFVIAYPTRST